MGHVAPEPHLKAGHAEVTQLPVVEDKVGGSELDDVHFVVQHYGVGCLDKT